MLYLLLILALQERIGGTQLLDCVFSAINRSTTGTSELDNCLVSLLEESSIFVADVDHRARPCLVDGARNEQDGKQCGRVGSECDDKLRLRHLG